MKNIDYTMTCLVLGLIFQSSPAIAIGSPKSVYNRGNST